MKIKEEHTQQAEKVWDDVFALLSQNYEEQIESDGTGVFVLDDDSRECLMEELTCYIYQLKNWFENEN